MLLDKINAAELFCAILVSKCKEGDLLLFNFFNLTCIYVKSTYLVCMALSAFDVVNETCAFHLGFRHFKDLGTRKL